MSVNALKIIVSNISATTVKTYSMKIPFEPKDTEKTKNSHSRAADGIGVAGDNAASHCNLNPVWQESRQINNRHKAEDILQPSSGTKGKESGNILRRENTHNTKLKVVNDHAMHDEVLTVLLCCVDRKAQTGSDNEYIDEVIEQFTRRACLVL